MIVKVCKTMLEPQEYEVASGTSDRIYTVTTPTLYGNDAICDPECKGYMYRGYCRHIRKAVDEAVCFYGTTDSQNTICPRCGGELLSVSLPNNSNK